MPNYRLKVSIRTLWTAAPIHFRKMNRHKLWKIFNAHLGSIDADYAHKAIDLTLSPNLIIILDKLLSHKESETPIKVTRIH